ncbi:MAG: hypothetical protein LBC82_02355 [Oscillospiraceae bacterium]|jgi:hypothetical protein|nr:hypothetical protein [Oscillospiraceae bacterium]
MNIEIKDLITLSDNLNYVVCSKSEYQGATYYYLIDVENNENIKFMQEKRADDKTTMIEVEDKELLQQLLPLFFEAGKHILNEVQQGENG